MEFSRQKPLQESTYVCWSHCPINQVFYGDQKSRIAHVRFFEEAFILRHFSISNSACSFRLFENTLLRLRIVLYYGLIILKSTSKNISQNLFKNPINDRMTDYQACQEQEPHQEQSRRKFFFRL